jgi:hypothetical protein
MVRLMPGGPLIAALLVSPALPVLFLMPTVSVMTADLGYSDEEIASMTPEDALSRIQCGERKPPLS